MTEKIAVPVFAALGGVVAAVWACGAPVGEQPSADRLEVVIGRQLDPPAAADSLAPDLEVVDGALVATWLEPSRGEEMEGGHRLRFSRLGGGGWSEPVTVSHGDDFFANWADLPGVVETGSGGLLAHWLAKTADETYAYSVFLARSDDRGSTWKAMGKLNSDETPTEHGFVSWVVEEDGARAFWLDGRAMADGGTMAVRTARVGDRIGPEEVLDERTCECCATDAAVAADGPLVVYRDRGDEELRDPVLVRRSAGEWHQPRLVHDDRWRIEGCPVNGPQVAARGDRVAVAWFTDAADRPAVKLAFSSDGGASFNEPLLIDDEAPLGRVDVVIDARGTTWMSWLGTAEGETQIRLQAFGPQGALSSAVRVADTSAARASGFPRLAGVDDALYLAWVDVGEDDAPDRIRITELRPTPRD